MSFGEMMDHYLNTEDTKEPQSVEAVKIERYACGVCHKLMSTKGTLTNMVMCGGRKVDPITGELKVCGTLNRLAP